MEKTWKPIAAGILDIIGGSLQLLPSLILVVGILTNLRGSDELGWAFLSVLIFAPLVVTGTIMIIGGIFALKRREFGIMLIGSLMSLAPAVPLYFMSTAEPFEEHFVLILTTMVLLAIATLTLTAFSRRECEIGKWTPMLAGVILIIVGFVQILNISSGHLSHIISGWGSLQISDLIVTILFILPALLAIVGGIYSLRKKRWMLGLAGAIAVFAPLIGLPILRYHPRWFIFPYTPELLLPLVITFPIIVVSLVLLLLSREQFIKNQVYQSGQIRV